MTNPRPTLPGVDYTLRLLSYLARQRGPVRAATIQRDLDLPRATVYRLLAALEEQGFIIHFAAEHRFGLGVAAFELSTGFTRQEPLSRLAAPILARLVDRVGESAHFSVLRGKDIVYLIEERAQRRPALVTEVGVRLPSDITASGRAMLSLMPPAQLRALFSAPQMFARRAGEEPMSYSRLRSILTKVRDEGFASEKGEVTEGIASVAVAVPDHAGWPVAAVAVSFDARQFDEGHLHLAREAAEAARDVARAARADVGMNPLAP